jgi:hypothetical protein
MKCWGYNGDGRVLPMLCNDLHRTHPFVLGGGWYIQHTPPHTSGCCELGWPCDLARTWRGEIVTFAEASALLWNVFQSD